MVAGGDSAHARRIHVRKTLCYLGELEQFCADTPGFARTKSRSSMSRATPQQLKLFPSDVAVPPDDPQVARVLLNKVRLERTRQFGSCFLGWELWKRLELDRLSWNRPSIRMRH